MEGRRWRRLAATNLRPRTARTGFHREHKVHSVHYIFSNVGMFMRIDACVGLVYTNSMPSAIPATVLTELNRQINQEFGASHNYRALSIWCEDRNLKGFSSYFAKQAAEEQEHAQKIVGHVLDRGVRPELATIAAPKTDFKSLLEAARHAQSMEQNNTSGVNAVYEAALGAKDYPTQVLMQWFISEQVEEEAWCLEMVERVEAATCAGGLSDLDRHIERYLAKNIAAE